MLLCVVLAVFLQVICYTFGEHWSYKYQDEWPQSCKGYLQSPINLPSEEAIDVNFGDFKFSPNSNQELTATLTNNGHSIVLQFPDSEVTISGGGLRGEYIFDSFHFHWCAEHTIDNLRYSLEGHFVYYDKKYKNLTKATEIKDGVAVFGVLYEISEEDNQAFNFVDEVQNVADQINKPVELTQPVILKSFFPTDVHSFYRYDGSLTTPNCNEVVIWTIFSEISFISEDQRENLIEIYDEEGEPLKRIYRKLQKTNGRPIYFNN